MTQDDFILAQKVEYTDALPYLLSRGWTRTTSKRDDVAILRKENAEVVLPLDRSLADYAESVATVAKRVADVEGGTAQHVLADLSTCASRAYDVSNTS